MQPPPATDQRSLHGISSIDGLMELIVEHQVNPNIIKNRKAVIHKFAKRDKYDHMLAILLHCRQPSVDINIANESNGNTPLHIAIEVFIHNGK